MQAIDLFLRLAKGQQGTRSESGVLLPLHFMKHERFDFSRNCRCTLVHHGEPGLVIQYAGQIKAYGKLSGGRNIVVDAYRASASLCFSPPERASAQSATLSQPSRCTR